MPVTKLQHDDIHWPPPPDGDPVLLSGQAMHAHMFVLPQGWTLQELHSDGRLMEPGSGDDDYIEAMTLDDSIYMAIIGEGRKLLPGHKIILTMRSGCNVKRIWWTVSKGITRRRQWSTVA